MEIVSLFPVPVGIFKLDRELTKDEYDFLSNLTEKPNEGNTTSENRYILELDILKELKKFISTSIDEYFKSIIDPKNDVKLRITQSWCNYTRTNQFHHKHRHPNSFLSGVFYADADDKLDKITFYPDVEYKQINFKPNNWNLFNSESWWLPVSSGSLLIFPSHLSHSVENKVGKNKRTSLAFNTFPVGYIGDDDSLTGLHI